MPQLTNVRIVANESAIAVNAFNVFFMVFLSFFRGFLPLHTHKTNENPIWSKGF